MQAQPGMVLVQCVWPPERGEKDDCKGRTGIVWKGHGDIQQYPAHLWPKLAEHPDVWRLYDPEADARVAAAKKAAADAAAAAAAAAEQAERIRLDEEARIAAAAKAAAAGNGVDLVHTEVAPQVLTAEQLAAMSDDQVRAEGEARGYALNPRLKSENLRPKFLELQAEAESEGGEA